MKQFFITLAAAVLALLIVFVALPIGAVVVIAQSPSRKCRPPSSCRSICARK
jgi:hypothetical protein